MKVTFQKITWCFMLLAGGMLQGGTLADVVVITNQSTREDEITAAALKNIYTGRTNYWQGGEHIVIAVLDNQIDEALNEVSGMDPSQFRTFWQRLVFSGRGEEPRVAQDPASLVALVASTKGAVALAPAGTPLDGVKVIELK
jgi:ABC-type phosphate transport system substrate-binding protein